MTKNTQSLSTKIVITMVLLFVTIMAFILVLFEQTNRQAFHDVELEKAQLIAATIEPVLAVNMYLGLDDKISELTRQLIDNPNILAVKIVRGGQTLFDVSSKKFADDIADSFLVRQVIRQPNSPKTIGTLELVYSNKGYKELIDQYSNMIFYLLAALVVIFILYSVYIRNIFFPLKRISLLLQNYAPDKTIEFPYIHENNEIGLITGALNEMQLKILEYAKNQKNINRFLEQKIHEKTNELRHQLYTDSLTALPNRLKIVEKLSEINHGALMIINIDDFKQINDFFGHNAGDMLLVKFSQRLKSIVDSQSLIRLYRLSGDEFALLVEKKTTDDALKTIILMLLEHIEKMVFFHEENQLSVRVTIGATLHMDAALEKADIALKSARKEHKSYLIYNEHLNIEKQYQQNMEWVEKLKYAIRHDNIVPYFQPIFDSETNRIVSFECLMRMHDRDNTVISPYVFLDIAKKSRLYASLTKTMVEKSCQHFQHLDCQFSINLSVEDILDEEVVAFIKEVLAKSGVAHKIIFEILESEGIENYKEVGRFIAEMKQLGCKIAVDDFGSGYSNFEHLLQLDIDYIKIDGTLIKNIDSDRNAQIIVKTIVDFAQMMKIETVAEFVQNAEVLDMVQSMGIDRTQGYYLGEPQKETACH